MPYARNDHWLRFFGGVADELVRAFAPFRTFDAGCALGLLVECLWDRGVQAHGRDISAWAIEQVRADVRPFCKVGSIADPIEGEYDLLTCIEVLEHMPEQDALSAIAAMAVAAPRILFSSSPTDLDEPTHCTVRPPAYWLARWAEVGFAPMPVHDAGYLAPHAFVLERSETGRTLCDLAAFADRVRHRVALVQIGARVHALDAELMTARREQTASDAVHAPLVEEVRTLGVRAAAAERERAELRDEVARGLQTVRDLTAARDRLEGKVAALVGRIAVADAELADGRHKLAAAVGEVRAEAEAELLRRATEDRRVRATATQRATEARVEAIEMRARAAVAEARTAEIGERIAEASQAAETALAVSARERTRAEAAEADAARLSDELRTAQTAWREMATARDRLLASTAWRATWPLRGCAEKLPRSVRRYMRQGLSAAWWGVTGQLPSRLRRRRAIVRDVRAVAASPLFDATWYVARNSDVSASGLNPALHFVTVGGPEGRDPGPGFSTRAYLERHPDAVTHGRPALLHFLENGQRHGVALSAPEFFAPCSLAEIAPPLAVAGHGQASVPTDVTQATKIDPKAVPAAPADAAPQHESRPEPELPALDALLRQRFIELEPLRAYAAPHDVPRVTIVTDSINAGSLYGGVGTALILATLLARRLNAGLRLVTRTEPADSIGTIGDVLGVHGIVWDGNLEVLHSPPGTGGREIPVGPRDMFLTTSWWITWATRRAVSPARIAYLLQEDERGFYPLGDDHLRCGEMLADPDLLYVVNSGLLMDHLRSDGLAPGGVAFEPAFPLSAYRPEQHTQAGPRAFFFYARPHNLRNLYWRGLEAVGASIEQGVLDPRDWEFHFVGKGAHDVVLPRGARPRVVHNLPWADYAGLVRRMDVGLSLMDTPHPSYPPLDLAASGAVVVTNRFGVKQSLGAYSPNILCAEPTVVGLVEGLRSATALVGNRSARAANFAHSGLHRDWETALAPALDRLAARFGR